MALRYGTSYWLARFPKSRRPVYPRHRGHVDSDVIIVGGGVTGCMTAHAFAAAGVKVALFEAHRLAQGSSAASTALLMQETDTDFRILAAAYGVRAARSMWQATRRATLDMAATIRRLNIKCGLSVRDSIYYTRDPDGVRDLRREYEARRAAGLEATWLTADRLRGETAIGGYAAIRTRGNAQIDPYRACLGWAQAASRRGALICEGSAVQRIRAGRKAVEVKTEAGTARAAAIIIATGYTSPEFKPLARHFRMQDTYVVMTPPLGAKIRSQLGRRSAMLWDTEMPYHYLRWTEDDRILFGGGDQPRVHVRSQEKILRQRAGQLMYELSTLYPVISGTQPDYAWTGLFAQTSDGLPYIGPHRNYPRHLFALGYGGNGMTFGFLAGRILLRSFLGEPAKGDDLFGFTR